MPEHDPQLARLKLPIIVKGAGILFAGGVISRLLGYAFNILAAKKVGLKGLGLYTLGMAVLRAIAIGMPVGSSSPVIRYVSMYHATGDQARVKGTILFTIKNTVLFSLVSAAAFFFLSDYLAVRIFHQPQLSIVLTYLAFSIPFVRLSSVLLRSTVGLQIMTFQTLTKDLLEPFAMLAIFLLLVLQGFRLQDGILLLCQNIRSPLLMPLLPKPRCEGHEADHGIEGHFQICGSSGDRTGLRQAPALGRHFTSGILRVAQQGGPVHCHL